MPRRIIEHTRELLKSLNKKISLDDDENSNQWRAVSFELAREGRHKALVIGDLWCVVMWKRLFIAAPTMRLSRVVLGVKRLESVLERRTRFVFELWKVFGCFCVPFLELLKWTGNGGRWWRHQFRDFLCCVMWEWVGLATDRVGLKWPWVFSCWSMLANIGSSSFELLMQEYWVVQTGLS
jgi:hypothetical protein